ncbi:DUF4261 domain-containing protein [Rhodopirellula sp. JC740]|uniref:DUF4261 domain-containing protein n=1 Tax=Rhodopirellula halodulae TaxID=2894198 RepID=A0ABS8NG01_9BACT|nr:DUF4261 domain-containing protein [Rhodopirellula sp. JC740]
MTMVSFILFSDDVEIPEERWQTAFGDDLPFRVRVGEVSCNESGIVEFSLETASSSQTNPGSIMLARMPALERDENAPPAALWPDFQSDMAAQQSHWIVTTFGSDLSLVEEALLLTHFTNSILQAFPSALGVLWNKHGLRVSAENFQTIVGSLEPDGLPTSVWIDILVVPASQAGGKPVAMTTGMDAFDLMEIECVGSPEPPDETYRRIEGVCEYLLNHGPVLKHGHTIGESDSERIAIVHGQSAFGREGKVMHLVYADAESHGNASTLATALALIGLPAAALAMIGGIVYAVGMLTRGPDTKPPSVAASPTEQTASTPTDVVSTPVPSIVSDPPEDAATVVQTQLLNQVVDWSSTKEIDLTVDDFWRSTDGMRDFESFVASPIQVPLDDLSGVRIAKPLVTPFAHQTLLVATGSTTTSRVNTRVAVGDLESGQILQSVTVAGVSAQPLAYSASRQMAWMSAGRQSEKLQGWRLHEDQVEQSEPWDPFQSVPAPRLPERRLRTSGIRFVYPMANSTLIVGNTNGHVVIWNIETMAPVAHYHVGNRPAWAVTPNGHLLALATSSELTIVDVRTNELVAKRSLTDLGSISWPKLDFSPDASELFLSSVSRIVILSADDGSITDDFTVGGLSTSNGAIFVDRDHVLVNGTHLISRTTQQTVRRLSGLGVPISFDRYTYAMSHDTTTMVLWPLELPTALDATDSRDPMVLTTSGLESN